jgi:RNA polymerase sigma-70 factor (ECF subfamily)
VTSTPRRSRFETTRWSLVLAVAGDASTEARVALATLCTSYWYPLYAYVRRQGYSAEDAQDLTQGFFARLLEKNVVDDARRERGRFRSFLLAAMKHFLLNEAEHRRALKRGGGRTLQSLDVEGAEARYSRELTDRCTPDVLFDRSWARSVLERVLARLRGEWTNAGKAVEFDRLKPCLTGEPLHGGYRDLGRELGLSEGAVKVKVHRFRRRYRYLLREEIGETVLTDDAVEDEIRHLFRVLSVSP